MKKDEIAASRWIKSLHSALAALDDIEMEEGVRKTIRRCLESEYSEAVDRHTDYGMHFNDGSRWTEEDDKIVREFLTDKPVPDKKSGDVYQDCRALKVELAYKLGRSEKNVEKRVKALGFRHLDSWY